ncbi:MAG: Hpt domain-containing protein [Bacteroidota bacterium]
MNFIKTFIQQTQKDLQKIRRLSGNLKISKNPTEILQSLQRTIHIIHGTSSLYSLEALENKSLTIENKIKQVLQQKADVPSLEPELDQYAYELGLILHNMEQRGEEGMSVVVEKETIAEPAATEEQAKTDFSPILDQLAVIQEDLSNTASTQQSKALENLQQVSQTLLQLQNQQADRTRGEALQLFTSSGEAFAIPSYLIQSIRCILNNDSLQDLEYLDLDNHLSPDYPPLPHKFLLCLTNETHTLDLSCGEIGSFSLLTHTDWQKAEETLTELLQKQGAKRGKANKTTTRAKYLLFQNHNSEYFSLSLEKVYRVEKHTSGFSLKESAHIPDYLQKDRPEKVELTFSFRQGEKAYQIAVQSMQLYNGEWQHIQQQDPNPNVAISSYGKAMYQDNAVTLLDIVS